MIQLRNIFLQLGEKLIFENVSLSVFRQEKIGIVGANGTGKTSVLGLLSGHIYPDRGQVDIQGNLKFAEMSQTLPSGNQEAIEFVLDGHRELRVVESELKEAQNNSDLEGIARAHESLDDLGAYSAKSKAARIMSGLGFSDDSMKKKVCELSGGWRARLSLAKALLIPSDILLLDEPNNHLDLDGIIWLERWLRDYSGVVLVVAHDRKFLDGFARVILHIENQSLCRYSGNYTDFETQRAKNLASRVKSSLAQKREIARIRGFVARFGSKASKAKQTKSRLKAIERMESLAVIRQQSSFNFEFLETNLPAHSAIILENVTAGYNDKKVLVGVNFEVRSRSRIGLIGRNGVGKTTLLKLLSGSMSCSQGSRKEGNKVSIGYLSQNQLESLNPEDSPIGHLTRIDPTCKEQSIRNFLAGFNFKASMATERISNFSGGEKSRLALALLVWQRPNVLLLDEPTNHLDIEMRLSLTLALQRYEGAMILISHDRSLLQGTCDELYFLGGGSLSNFEGDLEDYANLLRSPRNDRQQNNKKVLVSRKAMRISKASERNRLSLKRKPLHAEQKLLDDELNKLNDKKIQLEAEIIDMNRGERSDRSILEKKLKDLSSVQSRISKVEEKWLIVAGELEGLIN